MRNKSVILIVCIITMIVTLSGCLGKESIDQDISNKIGKNEGNYIRKFAQEINNKIVTEDDVSLLREYFEGIKSEIGEQTYLKNFDLGKSVLSVMYDNDYSVSDYVEKEIIVVEKEKETDVYIAYTYVAQMYDDIEGESGSDDMGYILQGINRYTFVENKLVNYKKIFD